MIYELSCWGREKSFYGKATVHEYGSVKELVSYTITVCQIDGNGEFHRLWGGYSATTMRHINSFRLANGMKAISKSEWEEMEVEDNV